MYHLRSRVRAVLAGSARPQMGVGARAPSTVASQVTPSQAFEMLDEETVPETEMFGNDSDEVTNPDKSIIELAEATQPPTPDLFAPNAPQSNT